jgi:predicted DCC family thiol-disulfide oxidoreductase YuxK
MIMKTLKHHTLLYDTDCPVCAAYTKGFIQSGMLDDQGRTPFETGMKLYGNILDSDRSRNEIALVNTQDHSVLYGIDSLNYVITQRFPFLKSLLNNMVVLFLLKKFYAFISFNRKVIAPSPDYSSQVCIPDFNLFYRVLYFVFSAALTSTILLSYSTLLQGIVPASNLFREYVICFGQIVFQGSLLLLFRTKKEQLFDYLGNMMTVSLIGGLLLLPVLFLSHYVSLPSYVSLAWFLAVVAFMFLQHRKRVRSIKAPAWLSYTWVLYRCLVLLFIL